MSDKKTADVAKSPLDLAIEQAAASGLAYSKEEASSNESPRAEVKGAFEENIFAGLTSLRDMLEHKEIDKARALEVIQEIVGDVVRNRTVVSFDTWINENGQRIEIRDTAGKMLSQTRCVIYNGQPGEENIRGQKAQVFAKIQTNYRRAAALSAWFFNMAQARYRASLGLPPVSNVSDQDTGNEGGEGNQRRATTQRAPGAGFQRR